MPHSVNIILVILFLTFLNPIVKLELSHHHHQLSITLGYGYRQRNVRQFLQSA